MFVYVYSKLTKTTNSSPCAMHCCTHAHTRTYIYNTHICMYHLHNPLYPVTPRTLCNTLPHTHAYMHIHIYHTYIYILIYTTCLTPWIVHTQYPLQYTPVHTRTHVYRYILHIYIYIYVCHLPDPEYNRITPIIHCNKLPYTQAHKNIHIKYLDIYIYMPPA